MFQRIILQSILLQIIIIPMNVHAVSPISIVQNEDKIITTKIRALYAKSPLIRKVKINITTINQHVTLSGQVKTKRQYEQIIALANSVKEIKSINIDGLSVKASDESLKDIYLTTKVKSSFIKEQLFGSKGIKSWPVKVEAKNSIVYLTGTVKSIDEKNKLILLAQATSGVSQVRSAITIE